MLQVSLALTVYVSLVPQKGKSLQHYVFYAKIGNRIKKILAESCLLSLLFLRAKF